MRAKTMLLLISVASFVAAGTITKRGQGEMVFLLQLFTLLAVSFTSLTVFFIKTKKIQDSLKKGVVKKIIVIFLPIGFLFFIALGFVLHFDDGDYVIWTTIDSVSYYIQAKIFSTGQFSVPSHKLKEFFSTGFFINDGKYYSKYFPGWPLILSIGIMMKLPWIINPVLSIASLIIVYFIGREIYDKDTGLYAIILLLTSSVFYVLTPTYFSEPSALFFFSLFFFCMAKTLKRPKISVSLLAGISLGIAFLIRPYSAVAISLPVMTYSVYIALVHRGKTLSSLITVVLSFLPALFVLLSYNHYQTGDFFLTPFQYYNPFDKLGFGLRTFDIIKDPYPFTLLDALKNTSTNLALLNLESVPLLFLFLFFVLINKKNKWDALLIVTLLSVILFQMFYFYRNTRYYYPAFFSLVLLAARGINLSELSFKKYFPQIHVKNLNHLFLLFIAMANVFIIISPQKVMKNYKSSQKMRDPFETVEKNNIKNSVIFLRTVPRRDNYTRMYVQNPLDYNGDVLFVRDLKERNKELMDYYAEKEFYYYDFDFKAKSGKLTKLK